MDLFDLTHSAMTDLRLSPTSNDPIEDKSNGQLPHRVPPHFQDLVKGLAPLRKIPTLVLGVQSDILFPVDQQREVADALRLAGNKEVSYYELGGVWGHDTFL
jgi:homoserine acetyltransferase